ncbi:hypothetical protein [Methyloversatilis sp.]|uniref:hypothetical protein n=1 Tax=Methyloversatilis sp. TaxID=2569862 RepID=UPI0035AE828E
MTESDFKSLTDVELLDAALWLQVDAKFLYVYARKYTETIDKARFPGYHRFMARLAQRNAAEVAEQSRLAVAEINRRKQNGIAS